MEMNSIGILGCGWLGKPTAEALIRKGYKVKGTTTTLDKLESLYRVGIEAYHLELFPNKTSNDFQLFLNDIDVLVIAIPPKLKNEQNELLKAFQNVFTDFDFSSIKKLIYISSTGVFMDGTDKVYDENSKPNNKAFRGQSLINLEQFIRAQKNIPQVCILRYGGLIEHGGRHPVYFLSGKEDLKNPDAPVNLIELQDAIQLLISIIEKPTCLPVYHGVYSSHPSRNKYYTGKAKSLNLVPPKFVTQNLSLGKTILSEITQSDLGFEYLAISLEL